MRKVTLITMGQTDGTVTHWIAYQGILQGPRLRPWFDRNHPKSRRVGGIVIDKRTRPNDGLTSLDLAQRFATEEYPAYCFTPGGFPLF